MVRASTLLVVARRRSGVSRRELARRAGTSAATVAAYEADRVDPGTQTLDRLLTASGLDACVTLTTRFSGPERALELHEVLELAAMFPARHAAGIAREAFPGRAR